MYRREDAQSVSLILTVIQGSTVRVFGILGLDQAYGNNGTATVLAHVRRAACGGINGGNGHIRPVRLDEALRWESRNIVGAYGSPQVTVI